MTKQTIPIERPISGGQRERTEPTGQIGSGA